MQVRKLAVSGVLVSTSWLALGVSTPAFALCEAYSGGCPSTPPNNGGGQPIGGGTGNPGTGNPGTGNPGTGNPGTGTPGTGTPARTTNPSALPFTGGELVLMTAVGAGAIAGGTALVVAGRRRRAV